ncbi:MAG: response regulator [Candidatus Hydrogenedentota bacterium]
MLFWRFLDSSVEHAPKLEGAYNPYLVMLSFSIAILAGYSALGVAERIGLADSARTRQLWLGIGAIAMGIGIWSMHFIGMLAFVLPIPVSYDLLTTMASLIPAIFASAMALHFMSRPMIELWRLNVGGLLMASGIGGMHYMGMEAMRMDAMMGYDLALFAFSILVVIVLTSKAERGDADRFDGLGFDAYLVKPVKQSYLLDCLMALFGAEQVSEEESPELITRHTLSEERHRRKNRILIADDNPMNQRVAQLMLEKMVYRADVVSDGAEVIELMRVAQYDLILMDCQMPEMDGYDATRAIRKIDDQRRNTPIIAMTANAMKGDREYCIEAGMSGYVSKPIDPELLRIERERFLENSDAKERDAI